MADRFWVTGGTGNWNSTTNWSATTGGASGASVPGSADTAAFDASSGAGTVTLDISPTIQTLTCTGFTGTLAFGTNTISLNSTGTIFTGATTMTVTGTPLVICTDNSATPRTITPTAVTEANSISFRITGGTGGLTLTAGAYRDLDFTDGVNPTGFAAAIPNTAITVYGNFKASTGMTRNPGTQVITFAATSGTKTIDLDGVTFDCPFTFNGVGGTWQLRAALTSGATRTVTLTNGALDLAGYTLTAGLFSSNNSNVRALAFGTGKIVLTATTGNVLSMSTATNFTYTGTSRIEVTASGAGRTIIPTAVGVVESTAMNIYVTTGSDTLTVSGAARFLNFDLTGFTGTLTYTSTSRYFGDLVFSSGMTVGSIAGTLAFAKTSGTQTITSNGKTIGNAVTIDTPGATVSLQDALSLTSVLTLNNGTLDFAIYTLTAGLFSSTNSNTRAVNFGTGKMVLTGRDTTVWTTGTGTGLTFTGTRTVEVTGVGVVGETRGVFGPSIDPSTANIADFYFKAGADTVSLGTANRFYRMLDFTGFSGDLAADIEPQIYGNLVLSAAMMVTGGSGVWGFVATTPQTITTNGVTINNPIRFDGVGGTWAMQDALTLGSTRTLTMINGTLQLKNGTTNTVGAFATSGTNQKFLRSTTPGSQATLFANAGTFIVNNLTIQDSNATGGAVWNATANTNVDAGNNTGWDFSDVEIFGRGNNIAFGFGFRI